MNKRIRKKKRDQARRAWAASLPELVRHTFMIDRNGRTPPVAVKEDCYWRFAPEDWGRRCP